MAESPLQHEDSGSTNMTFDAITCAFSPVLETWPPREIVGQNIDGDGGQKQ